MKAVLARVTVGALFFATLGAAQTLKIVRPVVSTLEDGPPLPTIESFAAGQAAFFSFQAEGYKVDTLGKVQLIAHVECYDSHGTLVAPKDEVSIATTLSQEDKDWKPKFRSQIILPAIAPPGPWKLKFDVTDQQTKQTVSGEAVFSVQGPAADPSSTLVIRNFGYYRTQDEANKLQVAAYQPGDMLWVRFDMTGYKYGEQNSIDVSYDVAIEGPGGKEVFRHENAAVEKSQAFYPQPWVPAQFNLTLQGNTPPGTYLMTIIARDGVGNQTAELKQDFRIEK